MNTKWMWRKNNSQRKDPAVDHIQYMMIEYIKKKKKLKMKTDLTYALYVQNRRDTLGDEGNKEKGDHSEVPAGQGEVAPSILEKRNMAG